MLTSVQYNVPVQARPETEAEPQIQARGLIQLY